MGNNVSIGHNALVHGCTVEDNVLIGMGSIVMDNCYIESNCIIAAGAVLLENTRVESWSVYAGIPAKKVKAMYFAENVKVNTRHSGRHRRQSGQTITPSPYVLSIT